MRKLLKIILLLVTAGMASAKAQNLDAIGVTLLRATTTNLNGSGIRLAQPEAGDGSAANWEVNPTNAAALQLLGNFTYTGSSGSANSFPNSVGSESGHADGVAGYFYGTSGGEATNAAHVDNYDANYFYNSIIDPSPYFLQNINDPVVNQSFIFCQSDYSHYPASSEEEYDSAYDNYAAQFKTLFISGAGNGGPTNQMQVYPAATCYNGIGVGAYGGSSCVGPTLDNGRCKPDIVAPGGETSWVTPQVAGAAAILMQAAVRGDGGNNTNAAADIRTVKALLLNGAVKPADWTNVPPSPLDFRYGAGVLNLFNSYQQLAGREQTNFVTGTTASVGGTHPPVAATNFIPALSAWNFATNTSGAGGDGVHHYFFNATNTPQNFTLTATLVWNRPASLSPTIHSSINNLALFLYNCANSNLVAASTSVVDNVQHIFLPQLAPGRYDLQVWKAGGSFVSAGEIYALAWSFSSTSLAVSASGTNVNLRWPLYPAGFAVASAATLTTPVWQTNNLPAPVLTNGQNFISVPATNAVQFFRLRTPNF